MNSPSLDGLLNTRLHGERKRRHRYIFCYFITDCLDQDETQEMLTGIEFFARFDEPLTQHVFLNSHSGFPYSLNDISELSILVMLLILASAIAAVIQIFR